jgi:hypothetical protein
LGALNYGYTTLIKGAARGVSVVTNRTVTETDIFQASRFLVAATLNNEAASDCDGDSFLEPEPWRDAGGLPHPVGGGLIPTNTSASTVDRWGRTFGYCAWDHGPVTVNDNHAGCGGSSALRLKGGDTKSEYSLAVISAGPDGMFQTTCSDYINNEAALLSKGAGSDDIFVALTYSEAFLASGVGGSGVGEVPDENCTPESIGLVRYENDVVQVCMEDGSGGVIWKEVGAGTGSGESYTPVTGAALSSVHTSNGISFTGFYGERQATVDNGATIILNGVDVGSKATIKVGDVVALRASAASIPETTITYTFKIGAFTRPWVITSRIKTAHTLSSSPTSVSNMWVNGESGETFSPTSNITIRNNSGEDSAVMGNITFSPAGNFEVTASTCTGVTLHPNQTCVVTVRAKASATAILSSTMTVASAGTSNGGTKSVNVSLSGDALFPVTLSNSTGVNLSTLSAFTTNGRWAQNRPKRVIIPAGVVIGSTNPTVPALRSGTGWGGTLYIANNGSIQGAGGLPSGGKGGTAFLAEASGIQFVNNGSIMAGGGAGGNGGAGGSGNYTQNLSEGPHYIASGNLHMCQDFSGIYWAGSRVWYNGSNMKKNYQAPDGWYYICGAIRGGWRSDDNDYYNYEVSRTKTVTVTGAGGAGGTGGRGQGYDGVNSNGVAGATGGANSGIGGTGGNGGTWGSSGTPGATGSTGSNAGLAGGAAGTAGYAIQNFGNVTLTGTGTRTGM